MGWRGEGCELCVGLELRGALDRGRGLSGECRPGTVEEPAEVQAAPEGRVKDDGPARVPGEEERAGESKENADADEIGESEVGCVKPSDDAEE